MLRVVNVRVSVTESDMTIEAVDLIFDKFDCIVNAIMLSALGRLIFPGVNCKVEIRPSKVLPHNDDGKSHQSKNAGSFRCIQDSKQHVLATCK